MFSIWQKGQETSRGRKHLKKIFVLLLIFVAVAALKIFHLDQYLTLSFVKSSHHRLTALYEQHRIPVIAAYMAVYILATSFSLPGAAILTLAGGALFGILAGTIIVSFSSTIGATLACVVSRFILRDWVQSRFGQRLRTVNKGVESEGAFYLFTLRLIPILPFWLINLVMGLTRMPVKTFYWVSQIGMLPGTLVYVNAGRELGRIDSLSGILSPGLIVSFVLLGLFPIVAKKAVALYSSKKRKIQ
jgi:uncharacterized membrane protein YdjX (TVP38/TMEM64 family)